MCCDTHESLQELVCGSCSQSISRSPELPLVFLLNNNIRLLAQDFCCLIVNEGAAQVNYHA